MNRDLELFYEGLLKSPEKESLAELLTKEPERIDWILETAVKRKDVKIIEALLSCTSVEVKVLNADKQTALHLAAHADFSGLVDTLLSRCLCNANCADNSGLSHFHIACMSGNVEIVRRFSLDGVDLENRCFADKWNLYAGLHFAVEYGRVEVVELLLKNGADPNAVVWGNATSLHLMCKSVARRMEEIFGLTDGSLESDSEWEIVGLLIKYGADVNAKDRFGNTPMMCLFDCFETTDSKFHSSFLRGVESKRKAIAVFRGKIEQIIELLLRNNANTNASNVNRETALHLILKSVKFSRKHQVSPYREDAFNASLARLVLRHGAKVDAIDRKDRSALQIAASLLNYEAVKVLVDYDADVSCVKFDHEDDRCFYHDDDDLALPSLEATENLIGIVELLVSRGLRLDLRDNLAVLKFFVRNGAGYVESKDRYDLYKLNNLLELGATFNITKQLGANSSEIYGTSFMEQSMRKRVILTIQKHLYISENLYLSSAVRSCLKSKLEKLQRHLLRFLNPNERLSPRELLVLDDEILRTKTTMLDARTSLYDVLATPPRLSYPRIKGCDYSAVLRAEDFWSNFPNSGGIIKGHFAKSLVRRYVVKSASEYLRSLLAVELPVLCCEHIFSNLSNECLLNLCLAAKS